MIEISYMLAHCTKCIHGVVTAVSLNSSLHLSTLPYGVKRGLNRHLGVEYDVRANLEDLERHITTEFEGVARS